MLFRSLPAEPGARAEAQAGFIWSQACTGKFVWPLPDKGLKKRMRRIAAPSLIVWGDADAVIAPDYAQDFAERIADARVALTPEPAICHISSSPKRRRVSCGSFSVANQLQRKCRPSSKFDSMMVLRARRCATGSKSTSTRSTRPLHGSRPIASRTAAPSKIRGAGPRVRIRLPPAGSQLRT